MTTDKSPLPGKFMTMKKTEKLAPRWPAQQNPLQWFPPYTYLPAICHPWKTITFCFGLFTSLGIYYPLLKRKSATKLCPTTFVTPGTTARKVHGLSRQEYWSGLPFPSLGIYYPLLRCSMSPSSNHPFELLITEFLPSVCMPHTLINSAFLLLICLWSSSSENLSQGT